MVAEPMHTDALSSAFQPLLFRDGVLCMPCLFTAGHAGLGHVHLILAAGAAVALLDGGSRRDTRGLPNFL